MPPPCPRHCFPKAYSEDRAEAQRFRPQRGDAGGDTGGDRRHGYKAAECCLAGRHDGSGDDNIYIRAASGVQTSF
jgi:hypothetical protein